MHKDLKFRGVTFTMSKEEKRVPETLEVIEDSTAASWTQREVGVTLGWKREKSIKKITKYKPKKKKHRGERLNSPDERDGTEEGLKQRKERERLREGTERGEREEEEKEKME